ncbi:hypothetical protein EV182_002507 [Spiromyces aspiralis]|uniref:Uncharacterized protein n=1 Tax=Spiromyces aspiralis TaxID=68401 RepID=A0ACC1HV52_9FUNG|nr:hypothetical protein EV182_002507 [Spiromyces aspiralis]
MGTSAPIRFRQFATESRRGRLAATASTTRQCGGDSGESSKSKSKEGRQQSVGQRMLVFDNKSGPSLQHFLAQSIPSPRSGKDLGEGGKPDRVPYLEDQDWGQGRKYFVEVYGCQMNVNDTEILMSVLNSAGYQRAENIEEADVIFLMTCAIREKAEDKIWQRLANLKTFKAKRRPTQPPMIGVLGCMAERLKAKLLESDKLVDIVCGPDAYRSLPRLLSLRESSVQGVANVMLSADETYADITPVRLNKDDVSVHLSIMRGCNNMCSFCIVPFTRGTERSRPIDSIIREVRDLSLQGVKEVTLLGQNVNSYRDTSVSEQYTTVGLGSSLSRGFKTIYKRKEGGRRFAELLDRVADVDPEIRIRFTSPHPKDFPDELIQIIRDRPNVCRNIHMPAQSGSSTTLERMRRGYTREAYLELVDNIRSIVPDITISSDFITGFCGETDAEHRDTVTLMETVQYDMAYMFAYSMREKTHAHRRLKDDVPQDVKISRLQEIISTFHKVAYAKNQHLVGSDMLVLVEGRSKKTNSLSGRDDYNHKIFIDIGPESPTNIEKGQYVIVRVTSATSSSLRGTATSITTLTDCYMTHLQLKNQASHHLQSVEKFGGIKYPTSPDANISVQHL